MSEPARPFRHLCPEADLRDAMTADEFWGHVFPDQGEDDPPPDVVEVPMWENPCPICGAVTECGRDNEDRPWVHTYEEEWDA